MNTQIPPIPFQSFNEHAPLRIYPGQLLPHWRQDGCTYFVTFRLADSLPRHRLEELRTLRNEAFQAMGVRTWEEARRRASADELTRLRRTLSRSLESLLDAGSGECILRDPEVAGIVSTALQHFHGAKVLTGDHVIMPNHVHALLQPLPGYALEDILRSVKGFSARQINRRLGCAGPLWQAESYDHIVRDVDALERIQGYIRANPEKAGLRSGFHLVARAFSPGGMDVPGED
jgi:REP element-mobilizing transposase RayT